MFESTAWLIYAYIVVGNILVGGTILCFVFLCAVGMVAFFGALDANEKAFAFAKKWIKSATIWCVIFTFLNGLYPDTSEIKLILGGAAVMGVGNAAVQLEGAEKLPQNLLDAANTFLEGIEKGATSE